MRLLVSLATLLVLSASAPLLAQDTQAPVEAGVAQAGIAETVQQGTLRLSSADEAETRDYPIESFSLSASFSPTYDGRDRTEMSLSLSLSVTPDAFLLGWMQLGQGDEGSRTLVIETGSPEDEASHLVYEIEEARVASFSLGGGYAPGTTSITLQVYTSTLEINGISMN